MAEAKRLSELQQAEATKDAEIQRLQAKLAAGEVAQKLALTEAVSVVTKERDELKSGLERAALEKQLAETALKDKYETQLKDRDGEIVRLRDMKARLSTKMIGETLEQHCEIEFNRLRATAFPKAYFEKDNDVRTGSKGDYIFRDMDDAGILNCPLTVLLMSSVNTPHNVSANIRCLILNRSGCRNQPGCEY